MEEVSGLFAGLLAAAGCHALFKKTQEKSKTCAHPASAVPGAMPAMARTGMSSGEASPRNVDAGQDDLVSSLGAVSIRSQPPTIRVPPISAYASGKPAVAIAGKAVVVGEPIAKAKTIPDNFSSTREYLKATQAHTQHEFAASLREGATSADRTRGGGWLPLSCRADPRRRDRLSYFVDGTPRSRKTRAQLGDDSSGGGGHDFTAEPWSRHVIQVEGETVPVLVVLCTAAGDTKHQAFLMLAPARGFGRGGVPACSRGLSTRVRSLGPAGPLLQQYGKAAELLKGGGSRLLDAVAFPGRVAAEQGVEGTFIPADVCALDTSSVPLNPAQREAVLRLSGGLDIVVGPPGTGKSTTIYHIIKSRVRQDAKVLVTSTRNQAVDAVTEKLHTLGVLVLGNENRLGDSARQHTIEARTQNDEEVVFWRRIQPSWSRLTSSISWRKKRLKRNFPALARLRKRGKAACLWAVALERVLQTNFDKRLKRLENGSRGQRRLFRQFAALDRLKTFLEAGHSFSSSLVRLELLTRFRILSETTVFVSTIDSSESSLRRLRKDIVKTAKALRLSPKKVKMPPLTIDTVILDEAGCVLETAIPVLLSLGTKNLTLVGDHNQLRPFSHVREGKASMNHSRSLMERAINSGMAHQFLDTQYRMHPDICDIVSRTFYDNKLLSAEVLKGTRRSPQPCRWIHVSGGEKRHEDRGFSNPREVPQVVQQAKAAMRRYGTGADVRVITFYNMQKLALDHAFKNVKPRGIRIVSVDSCQGSDADVVIISTVRSGGSRKLSGFMLDRSRVNVAISRAKQECIIVGDKDTLRSRGGAMWRSVVDHYAGTP